MVTLLSDSQPLKALNPMLVTLSGIVTAPISVVVAVPKVILFKLLLSEKQKSGM
jgi:hypothetical protein